MLHDDVQLINRALVEKHLGYEPSRKHWTEAENMLAIAHKVKTKLGAHGKKYYQQEF